MTKIAFEISKNTIASQTDPMVHLADDSTAHADTMAKLWLDDQLVASVTVTDEGGHLEYTTDLAVGDHTLEIRSQRGDSTDIHIDRMLIDDRRVMPTQYRFREVIFGEQSSLREKMCVPYVQHCGHGNYLWWGQRYSDDGAMIGTHYRAHLVSDHGWNWRWNFTVKEDGTVYWTHTPDPSDANYDSTQHNPCYLTAVTVETEMDWGTIKSQFLEDYLDLYAAAYAGSDDVINTDDSTQFVLKIAYGGNHPDTPYGAAWQVVDDDSSYLINQQGEAISVGTWQGPGVYNHDLIWVNGESETSDNLSNVVLNDFPDYTMCVIYKWWQASYPITPITVTTV